jgi:hypothetical protein
MAVSVRALLAARERGSKESLRALAIALAARLDDPPGLPTEPAAVWSEVENRGAEAPGTWQEVRAARDHGEISDAEYDYLAAAVDALTLEGDEG